MTTLWVLVALVVTDQGYANAQVIEAFQEMDQCMIMREVLLEEGGVDTHEARAKIGAQALCVAKNVDFI